MDQVRKDSAEIAPPQSTCHSLFLFLDPEKRNFKYLFLDVKTRTHRANDRPSALSFLVFSADWRQLNTLRRRRVGNSQRASGRQTLIYLQLLSLQIRLPVSLTDGCLHASRASADSVVAYSSFLTPMTASRAHSTGGLSLVASSCHRVGVYQP